MLSGIEAVEVPLDAGGRGKALTIPVIGHGFAMVPLAYAVMAGEDAAIFVQAYLDPNKPRNLNAAWPPCQKRFISAWRFRLKPSSRIKKPGLESRFSFKASNDASARRLRRRRGLAPSAPQHPVQRHLVLQRCNSACTAALLRLEQRALGVEHVEVAGGAAL